MTGGPWRDGGDQGGTFKGNWHRKKSLSAYKLMCEVEQLGCLALETCSIGNGGG